MRHQSQAGLGSSPRWVSLLSVLAWILLWFLLTPKPVPKVFFPSPASVWGAVQALGSDLAKHAGVTLLRVMAGWCWGVLLGIRAGLWMTRNRFFRAAANPLIEALRPVPPVALIPFFIVWFGLGWGGQVLLIGLGCFMVMVVNTYGAVHNVPPIYIRAAASLGAPTAAIYRTVIWPAILPSLVPGFRIAAALAFALGVAAEFMGAQSGIGFLVMINRRQLNTDMILLSIIIIGAESFAVDWVIRVISRYKCRWSETPVMALQRLAG
jgi:taurine transport system permease protein